ncbi:MAG: energy transducer TonB [Acidobacteria bacterium]|nr:energy transducer TonB [Acidobacteriota bacterium]
MADEEKYSHGKLDLGGYGSAPQADESEIKHLREITAGREQAEAPAPKRNRKAFLVLGLLVVVLGLVWTSNAFLLPTEIISDLFIEVDTAVAKFTHGNQSPVILPAAAEETQKPSDPKASKRRPRAAGGPSAARAGSGSAVEAVETEPEVMATPPPTPKPFNVEVVDADRRVQPRYTNRTVNLNVEGGLRQSDTGALATRPPSALAREGSVQGSVVLRAVIDRQGQIRELAVVRGPADLTAAAIEAARHRRFQPNLQNGQPVETETLITVDFNISAQ